MKDVFQFLDISRQDPVKRDAQERVTDSIQAGRCLDCGNPTRIANGNAQCITSRR